MERHCKWTRASSSPRIGQPTILPSATIRQLRKTASPLTLPPDPSYRNILVGECLREPPPFARHHLRTRSASTNLHLNGQRVGEPTSHRNGAITTNALTKILRRTALLKSGTIPFTPGARLTVGIPATLASANPDRSSGTEHIGRSHPWKDARTGCTKNLNLEYIDGSRGNGQSPTNFGSSRWPNQQADWLWVSFMTPAKKVGRSVPATSRTHVMELRDPRPRKRPGQSHLFTNFITTGSAVALRPARRSKSLAVKLILGFHRPPNSKPFRRACAAHPEIKP